MGIQSAYSIVAASRNESRENSAFDLPAAWVSWAADILFVGQALSFGVGDCGMAGFAVAALFRRGRTRGSAGGGRPGGGVFGGWGREESFLIPSCVGRA